MAGRWIIRRPPRARTVALASFVLAVACTDAAHGLRQSQPRGARPRPAAVNGPGARARPALRLAVRVSPETDHAAGQDDTTTLERVFSIGRSVRLNGAPLDGEPSMQAAPAADHLRDSSDRTASTPAPQALAVAAPHAADAASDADAAGGILASMDPALRANLARGTVLALTIVWATNFPVIKSIFGAGLTPPDYALLRFLLAAGALVPFARWDNPALVKGGVQCGAWVATGYVTQAIALTTASANKGAFICACQVIFVALFNAIGTRTFVPRTWAAAVLAITGVGLLELAGPVRPEWSDLWCLGMPVCFGMGYIRLEQLMEEYPEDALTVSALKVGSVGAVALGWSLVRAAVGDAGAGLDHLLQMVTSAGIPWPALFYTGLVTTAGAILVESFAFKYVPATDAAVILATEPLWAAIFAAQMLGENLTPTDVVGGALVIAACIVNELKAGDLTAEK